MPYKDDQVALMTMPMPNIWRGSEAPPEVGQSDPLLGEIRTAQVESEALDETRDLSVYLPPDYDPEQTYLVIYMADGQSLPQFAPFLEPLIAAGDLPPILIIGVHSSFGSPGHDLRAEDYIPTMNPDRFAAHERFFTVEVRRYAETEFGAAADRAQRVVFGYSNGGVFAAAMGLRHPELYAHILAFSPGVLPGSPREDSDLVADYYLVSGTLEPNFYRNTLTLKNSLENLGAVTEFKGRVAGHDQIMWQEEFPGAVRWAFT
jgi:enterochelin esterase-like enzyme